MASPDSSGEVGAILAALERNPPPAPQHLAQLELLQRRLDHELHELVQARYGELLEVRERLREGRAGAGAVGAQLSALRSALAQAQHRVAHEATLVQGRLHAARTLGAKEHVLRRSVEAARLLEKVATLLRAPLSPPSAASSSSSPSPALSPQSLEDSAAQAARIAASLTLLQAWWEEGQAWAWLGAQGGRIEALRGRLLGELHALTRHALRGEGGRAALRLLWGAYASLRAHAEAESLVASERITPWLRGEVQRLGGTLSTVLGGEKGGEEGQDKGADEQSVPAWAEAVWRVQAPQVRVQALPLVRVLVRVQRCVETELLPLALLRPDLDLCFVLRALLPALDAELKLHAPALFVPPPAPQHALWVCLLALCRAFLAQLRPLLPPHERRLWSALPAPRSLLRRFGVAAFVAQRQREVQAHLDAALGRGEADALRTTLEGLWAPATFLVAAAPRTLKLSLDALHRHCLHLTAHLPADLSALVRLLAQQHALLAWLDGAEGWAALVRPLLAPLPGPLRLDLLAALPAAARSLLGALLRLLEQRLAARLVEHALPELQGLRAVPARYRLTGRPVDAPSPYVEALAAPWTALKATLRPADLALALHWFPPALRALLKAWGDLATQVLQAERDKEKILQRVTKPSGEARGPSDADKVALQLRLDLELMRRLLQPEGDGLDEDWAQLHALTLQ